jgi:hypothetical protein
MPASRPDGKNLQKCSGDHMPSNRSPRPNLHYGKY